MKKMNVKNSKFIPYLKDTLAIYFKDIYDIKLLNEKEEKELLLRIKNNDKEALDKLVLANLRFVVSVAKQYLDDTVSMEDLVSEGNLALITAAKKFDPNKNVKFISYAIFWIRKYIQEYKIKSQNIIHQPFKNNPQDIQRKRELKKLMQEYPEINFDDEEKINYVSIYQQQDDHPLIEKIDNNNNNILNNENEEEKNYMISFLIRKLNPNEKKVILMYFGINCDKKNLENISEELQISKENVRQIKTKALEKIKKEYIKYINKY